MIRVRRFWRDTRGAAAVEMALVTAVLALPVLNVVDLGVYAYQTMQVSNAAETGGQAAWTTCNTAALWPATTKCANLSSTVSTSINNNPSTGTDLSLQSSYPTLVEGYYCADTTGALVQVPGSTTGTVSSPTASLGGNTNCSKVTNAASPTSPPGDYVHITVSYAFTSLMPGFSVASLLPSPITSSAWVRLD